MGSEAHSSRKRNGPQKRTGTACRSGLNRKLNKAIRCQFQLRNIQISLIPQIVPAVFSDFVFCLLDSLFELMAHLLALTLASMLNPDNLNRAIQESYFSCRL
jgi:hypothetical protein